MALRSHTIGIVLAAAVAAGSAHAAQFVVNGDFTQLTSGLGQLAYNTNATGWTTSVGYNFVMQNGNSGSNGQYGNVALWTQTTAGNGWNGLSGSGNGNFLAMDGDFQTAAVSQTLQGLTVGDSYKVSFYYAFSQQTNWYGATNQDLTFTWGSQSFTSTPLSLPSQGFSGWQLASGSLVADSANEVISFLAYGANPTGGGQLPPFALVSDVSVTGGVPEASTWAMMLVGFAGLGYAGFHTNRRKPTAIA